MGTRAFEDRASNTLAVDKVLDILLLRLKDQFSASPAGRLSYSAHRRFHLGAAHFGSLHAAYVNEWEERIGSLRLLHMQSAGAAEKIEYVSPVNSR